MGLKWADIVQFYRMSISILAAVCAIRNVARVTMSAMLTNKQLAIQALALPATHSTPHS